MSEGIRILRNRGQCYQKQINTLLRKSQLSLPLQITEIDIVKEEGYLSNPTEIHVYIQRFRESVSVESSDLAKRWIV